METGTLIDPIEFGHVQFSKILFKFVFCGHYCEMDIQSNKRIKILHEYAFCRVT